MTLRSPSLENARQDLKPSLPGSKADRLLSLSCDVPQNCRKTCCRGRQAQGEAVGSQRHRPRWGREPGGFGEAPCADGDRLWEARGREAGRRPGRGEQVRRRALERNPSQLVRGGGEERGAGADRQGRAHSRVHFEVSDRGLESSLCRFLRDAARGLTTLGRGLSATPPKAVINQDHKVIYTFSYMFLYV